MIIQAFKEAEVPATPFTLLLFNLNRMFESNEHFTNKTTNEELSIRMTAAYTLEIKRTYIRSKSK